MNFQNIVGLETTKLALINSVKSSHIAHAQLFVGKNGSANLGLALCYAQYVNCEQKSADDSCGQCSSCLQYKKVVHPDMHFVFPMASLEKVDKENLKAHLIKFFRKFVLDHPYSGIQDWGHFVGAENKQFSIPVDEGRGIIHAIALKPFQGEYKIVLIWMAEFMNIQTANSILKVLEEPPAKTIFLLIANDYEKLLPTIISRCQMVYIPSFTDSEIVKHLVLNKICDEKIANQISKISDGNMGRALQLALDEPDDSLEIFKFWMRLCFGHKYAELITFCEDLSKKGRENQKNLLLYSLQIVRDALMSKLDLFEIIKQDQNETSFVQNFGKSINQDSVEKMYDILNVTYQHIERNGNPKIVFLDTSILIAQLFERK